MTISPGQTYQFNTVLADVFDVSAELVVWTERKTRWGKSYPTYKQRSTPRWYFEKYAEAHP